MGLRDGISYDCQVAEVLIVFLALKSRAAQRESSWTFFVLIYYARGSENEKY
jgi:hypothetical protein